MEVDQDVYKLKGSRLAAPTMHDVIQAFFTLRVRANGLTQIKHSYWFKSWNRSQELYTRTQAWNRKNIFNLPKLLLNAELYGLVLSPSLKKGYYWIWEANLQPL
jgi:hypothetical protein